MRKYKHDIASMDEVVRGSYVMLVSAKTAMSRHAASQPLRQALHKGLVLAPVLDWGCGRGADVRELQRQSIDVFGYDPYWQPSLPTRLFNFGLCTYVLNTISSEEQDSCLQQLQTYLYTTAVIWVSVRSAQAIEKEAQRHTWKPQSSGYITSKGTYQQGFTTESLDTLLRKTQKVVVVWQQRDTIYGCAS